MVNVSCNAGGQCTLPNQARHCSGFQWVIIHVVHMHMYVYVCQLCMRLYAPLTCTPCTSIRCTAALEVLEIVNSWTLLDYVI